MTTSTDSNSYDELPYCARPFYDTHPYHLAAIGLLFGVQPAEVESCRVLELGCANGANLIPMAEMLPGAKFVGIDLSTKQVEDGKRTLAELQLKNIELHAMSIMDIDRDFGEFDYILCHGVYSWVPPEVQDKILQVMAQNLAPQGLVYVSYNTYPGWHIRAIAREMMNFHVRNCQSLREKVQHAQPFLEFLTESLPNTSTPYARLLKGEAELLKQTDISYLAHEHLESFNQPVYFHEFMQRASAKGLQFVAESRFETTAERLAPEAVQGFRQFASNWIEWEQYMDFLNQRAFRRSVLCHQNVPVQRPVAVESLRQLRFASMLRPKSEKPDLSVDVTETFEADDRSMTTNHPAAKALALVLWEAIPQTLSLDELQTEVNARLPNLPEATVELPELLKRTVLGGLVDFQIGPIRHQSQAPEYPQATPLARLQANDDFVTNLRHRALRLEDFDRAVLRLLDGTRNREQLLQAMVTKVQDGSISLRIDGEQLTDPVQIRECIEGDLSNSLLRLAYFGMLLA